MNGAVTPEALIEAMRALLAEDGLLIADDYLGVPEAAEAAGVSRSVIYEWTRAGLPFLDEGVRGRRIRRSELGRFMRDREVVMIGGKKLPVARPKTKPGESRGRQLAIRSTRSKKVHTAVAAHGAKATRVSGGGDRASLQAVLDAARKAA